MIRYINQLRRITGGSSTCGWMCDEVAQFLHAQVRFYKPEVVIQTGHLWGKSACAILDAFNSPVPIEDEPQNADECFARFVESHTPKVDNPILYSIDPDPMGVPHWREGVEWLEQTFPNRFRFVQQTSDAFFAEFETASNRVMGVVDGNHTDDGCWRDLINLADLGARLILVDDTQWIPSLLSVCRRFARERGYGMVHFPTYNGIAILTHD